MIVNREALICESEPYSNRIRLQSVERGRYGQVGPSECIVNEAYAEEIGVRIEVCG